MPHIILEHSASISVSRPFLQSLHELLASFETIQMSEIKSRSISHNTFSVGDGGEDRTFIHLQLALLPGRPLELKQKISKALLEKIRTELARNACSYSVELRELEKETYAKVSG